MAQLTPNEILEISEPIEAIYQRTVDELLINIAHHFNISGWERTRYWEIKKLSEMGALTEESARIIAQNTKLLPEEVEKAFLQVSEKACLDIDPQLRKAAEKGILQDPGTSPTTSILMRENVRSFTAQALDTFNMVNTTMLQSTREAYLRGITTAVNEAQLQEAKEVLETQAFNVVTGAETRTRAIRKAMNQLAATGITGFYDRAGRKWNAEGYAAMVVRTTAHNAAIEAIKTRQREFGGGDIFQVSTHPGARPLCYPYQGKFYSWSEPGGEFTDGAGHTHKYENIEASSYGQAAGLFGINCGHHPIPMIPGFSYPQDIPKESPEENKKEYEESQKQRAYERQIRENKRDLEIAKATGDEESIKAAKEKVAKSQAEMRGFIKDTGRARRYDREQVAGTPLPEGYKGWQKEINSDLPTPPKTNLGYDVVSNRQEAYNSLNKVFGSISDNVKSINEELLVDNVNRFNELNARFKAVTPANIGYFTASPSGKAQAWTSSAYNQNEERTNLSLVARHYKKVDALVEQEKRGRESFFQMPFADSAATTYTITHEYGHILESFVSRRRTDWESLQNKIAKMVQPSASQVRQIYKDEEKKQAKNIFDEIVSIAKQKDPDFSMKDSLSKYGHTNHYEFFAEVFANSQCGKPNTLGEAMIAWLKKEGL